jgi:glycerophosphoryl diester phosphodiesterase
MGRQPPDILVPFVSELSARRAKRIGHKGADLIAPGNTLASFDAALEAGVDMVEFDVLPEHPDGTGRLVLAHDFKAARRGTPVTLEEGLEHFRQDAWSDVELDVDLKLPGYELGWSVPKLRRNPLSHPVTRVASLPALQVARRMLPGRAARELRAGRIDALMAHWALVTPRLARAVRDAGGELYVWTVDDARRIAALERLGVTGVITNDPRLFAGDVQGVPQPAVRPDQFSA